MQLYQGCVINSTPLTQQKHGARCTIVQHANGQFIGCFAMSEAEDQTLEKAKASKGAIGVKGVYIPSGYVFDEFQPELQGEKGRKKFREMADNDPIIGAFLYASDSILRAAEWHVDAAETDSSGEGAKFFEECMNDMDSSWSEFISEVNTQLIFGFSFFEKIYKRRVGPYERNPARNSKYTDGRIGIYDLAPRAQETLQRWDVDEDEIPIGFIQQPFSGGLYNIPLAKGLLFRTTTRKGNPEGRSMLRNAYKPYYYKDNIQTVEAIGIERDLAGLPVVRIPNYLFSSTEPGAIAAIAAYVKMARDLKYNSQGGCVIPSDPWTDTAGKITNQRKVDIELISSSGTKSVDTNLVIGRYERSILMSVLAEFLMLGSDGGSYALSKNKSDLFLRSLKCLNDGIAGVINKSLIPELWNLNGFPVETMPRLRAGDVAPDDLDMLGNFLKALSASGVMAGSDLDTENHLRRLANLPEVTEPSGGMALNPDMDEEDPPKEDSKKNG